MIELETGRGRQGVGFRSTLRKFSISQTSLRRLHSRLLEDGFFKMPDWETQVLDSNAFTNSGSEDEDED